MRKSHLAVRNSSADPVIEALADRTRRETLAALRERTGDVPVAEVATALEGGPLADVTSEDRRSVRVSLVHAHLPKLDDADLVAWDREADAIATTDHPVLGDPRFDELLAADDADLDAVLGGLSEARRRCVVSVLESADGAVDRETLARRVAAREHDVAPAEVPPRECDAVRASLHHAHLPALREAGLVTCDDDAISLEAPDLDVAWLADAAARADEADRLTAAVRRVEEATPQES